MPSRFLWAKHPSSPFSPEAGRLPPSLRLITRQEAKLLDEQTQSDYKIAQEQLIRSAGRVIADFLSDQVRGPRTKFVFLVGPGHNGDDAIEAAQRLRTQGGVSLRCLAIAGRQPQRETKDHPAIEELGGREAHILMTDADWIVDGVFGIGFNRELTPEVAEFFAAINQRPRQVLAIDIASGLDANTGLGSAALRAEVTLTFGAAKVGQFLQDGPSLSGRVIVCPLDFPLELIQQHTQTVRAVGSTLVSLLPLRGESSHKGNFGRCLVVAGSKDFPGAGLLSAQAAQRMGAGYVELTSSQGVFPDFVSSPELILREDPLQALKKCTTETSVVLGPGLGISDTTRQLLDMAAQRKLPRVVLDADALSVLSQEPRALPSSWILTPHEGEMARLLGLAVHEVIADRRGAANRISEKYNCLVLAKGYRTLVCDAKRSLLVLAGNSALAKAGSGDVLAGFIGSLLAQGLAPREAAATAAYIHGSIADHWVWSKKDPASLVAGDLLHSLPEVLGLLRN